jgi:hypothetical protein
MQELGFMYSRDLADRNYPGFAENTMAKAERWAARIGGPAYAIDDQTAIKVADGKVEVVSERKWRYFGGEGVLPGGSFGHGEDIQPQNAR